MAADPATDLGHRDAAPADSLDGLRFSIVIPLYESPLDHLQAQLASIASQTHQDFECVLVDDGSPTAAVGELAAAVAADDPRFRLIRRPRNGGISAATNDGVAAARGAWIVFGDHDDLFDADALRTLDEHITEHPEVQAIYTDETLIDEHGDTIATYGKPDWSPIRHLGHHYPAHLSAMRRHLVVDELLRSGFEPSQDYDLWLRVVERVGTHPEAVGHVPRRVYAWRAIAGSSARDAAEKPEMCEAVRRCVAAAVERRGLPAEAITVDHDDVPTTSVRLAWHELPDRSELTVAEITPDLDADALTATIEAASTPLVLLHPAGTTVDDAGAIALAAEVARRPDVVAAGPALVDRQDGRIVSVGRTSAPRLIDPFVGEQLGAGPWGADLVVREVSALSPAGMVVDRTAWLEHRPSSTTIDGAVAEFCRRAADAGRTTVVVPHVVVPVPRDVWGLRGGRRLAVARDWAAVASTLPDVADPFLVGGATTPLGGATNCYDAAVAELADARVELVTSDVFDTLVTRDAATPSDVFVTLGEQLVGAGILAPTTTPRHFAAARRAAERRARTAHVAAASVTAGPDGLHESSDPMSGPHPECTLDEIWAILGDDLGLDPSVGIEHELAHEATRLRPIPEAIDLVRQMHGVGLPVVLVSDMYLSSSQLSDLLGRVGVPMETIADVVTSADRRRGKPVGLLDEVIAERGVEPDRVLHLGDHPVADVHAARRLGARVVQVELDPVHQHVDRTPDRLAAWSARHGTDLGVSATVRRTLLAAGDAGLAPTYQLGAVSLGPTMFGFGRWLRATADDLGVGALHFLLREGATIAELVERAAPDDAVDLRLVHASRWVDVRATVFDGSASEIQTAIERKHPFSTDQLARTFDLDVDRVRRLIGGRPIEPHRVPQVAAMLAEDGALRGAIVEYSARLRQRVVGLLERELDLSQPVVALVDVGWGGRIQEAVTALLRSAGHTQPVVGLYLALSEAGVDRAARGHDLRSYLPNEFDDPDPRVERLVRQLAHDPDVVERILMPELPTFVDVDAAGNPVLADRVELRSDSLRTAQLGLRDVVGALADAAVDDRWVTDLAWRGALAEALHAGATQPTERVAIEVSGWGHDDVGGDGVEALVGADTAAELAAYASARDIGALLEGTRGSIDLVAARWNPTTAAHRRAVADGHPLDLVSPPHPAGDTRLSVFAHGSETPAEQRVLRSGATVDGWSVIRVRGTVPSLRAVRFDAGTEPSVVELRELQLVVGQDGDDAPRSWTHTVRSLTDDAVRVVGGRRLDGRRYAAVDADSHLLVPVGASLGDVDPSVPCTVEVAAVFRRWTVDPDDAALRSSRADRVNDAARRIERAARRLTRR